MSDMSFTYILIYFICIVMFIMFSAITKFELFRSLNRYNFAGLSFVGFTFFSIILLITCSPALMIFNYLGYEKSYLSFIYGSQFLLETRSFIIIFSFILILSLFLVLILLSNAGLVRLEYFYFLIMLGIFVIYLGVCDDLVGIILIIEGISFILYIFAVVPLGNSYKYYSLSRIRSYIRYILFGLFSSSLMLFGLSLIYLNTGLLNLSDINLFIKYSFIFENNLVLPSMLILIGLLFKLAIVPFHTWLPDVYINIENLVISFFAMFTKTIFSFLLLLKFEFLYLFNKNTMALLLFCSLSICVGAVGAFIQTTINGLIAYSSISNIAYVIILTISHYIISFDIAIVYLLTYSISNFLIFYTLYMFRRSHQNRDYLFKINNFIALSLFQPRLSLLLSLALFALMGFPPFVGFYIKFFLISSLFIVFSKLMATVVLFFMILTFFYYIRIVKNMFFYSDYRRMLQTPITTWPINGDLELNIGFFSLWLIIVLADQIENLIYLLTCH
jgi:NADH-quinone oxidoreductase subunit N